VSLGSESSRAEEGCVSVGFSFSREWSALPLDVYWYLRFDKLILQI
jgi:hypothetical protein